MSQPTDFKARQTAVDTSRSVLVQAPAGSGKTTLLVERFLGLLAQVDAPEEILAMTFTRKAAAAMRDRVLEYLSMTAPPAEPHERSAYDKAQAVAGRVAEWRLLDNPSRLNIFTIDSFCSRLAKQMPVLSRLGQSPRISEMPVDCYRDAAVRTLGVLENNDELSPAIGTLLTWRDNDRQAIEKLLVSLMPARDRWLRVLGANGAPDRDQLEAVIEEFVCGQLNEGAVVLVDALSAAGYSPDQLAGLAAFAADHPNNREKPVSACQGLTSLPDTDIPCVAQWRGLADMLLTGDGDLRKRITVRDGFPAKTAEQKQINTLMADLAGRDDLAAALAAVRALPDGRYPDDQWDVLEALVRILQRCALELEVVFAERGECDYAGVQAAALHGLGDADDPTDLSLYLDYRIRHVLVDEFQDTNWSQYRLLSCLTAGWEVGDGRTLFLVGDPMQSIYGFREAEVGLFMQIRDFGIGDIHPEFVQLSENFRSRKEVVEWVNSAVGQAFPGDDDMSIGAVAFARGTAALPAGGEVKLLPGVGRRGVEEARAIADEIEATLAREDTSYRIAIIVRNRKHLRDILPELRERGIAFSALKLDALIDKQVVQDIHALARAIYHPGDQTAWLAILRAPWCGLTLADLVALTEGLEGRLISTEIFADEARRRLSDDGRTRVARLSEVMRAARGKLRSWPLRDVVEGAWRALGGDLICESEADRLEARRYLDLLSEVEVAGDVEDWTVFETRLAGQQSEGVVEGAQVEILTIHGAKGLEWDMVVLPGLERPAGKHEQQLLEWVSLFEGTDERLFMAPIRGSDQSKRDRLAAMVMTLNKAKAAEERKRLLYVAATRARRRLIVSGSAVGREGKYRVRDSGSMLADLWPAIADAYTQDAESGWAEDRAPVPDQRLLRVPAGWAPPCPEPVTWQPVIELASEKIEIEYDWASYRARQVGRVMHRVMEIIGERGLENMSPDEIDSLKARVPTLLALEGLAPGDVRDKAAEHICAGLDRTLADDRGRWILGQHAESACELPLSGVVGGKHVNIVVDRTFVADGVRWVIDWKSGYHAGGGLDAFIVAEKDRHRAQMGLYQRVLEGMESRPVRTALYLPLHAQWIEIG